MNGGQGNNVSIGTVVRDAASLTIGLLSLAVRAIEQQLHAAQPDVSAPSAAQVPRQSARGDAATVVDTFIGGAMLAARGPATAASLTIRSAQTLTRPVTRRIGVD